MHAPWPCVQVHPTSSTASAFAAGCTSLTPVRRVAAPSERCNHAPLSHHQLYCYNACTMAMTHGMRTPSTQNMCAAAYRSRSRCGTVALRRAWDRACVRPVAPLKPDSLNDRRAAALPSRSSTGRAHPSLYLRASVLQPTGEVGALRDLNAALREHLIARVTDPDERPLRQPLALD